MADALPGAAAPRLGAARPRPFPTYLRPASRAAAPMSAPSALGLALVQLPAAAPAQSPDDQPDGLRRLLVARTTLRVWIDALSRQPIDWRTDFGNCAACLRALLPMLRESAVRDLCDGAAESALTPAGMAIGSAMRLLQLALKDDQHQPEAQHRARQLMVRASLHLSRLLVAAQPADSTTGGAA